MTKTKTSEGRPWTAAGFYDTYNLAEKKSNQIKTDQVQTKIRRRANGKFLVKYRQNPSIVKEEKKNGKKDKKSRKRDTDKRKFEIDETGI